jgi:hypothetical protein
VQRYRAADRAQPPDLTLGEQQLLTGPGHFPKASRPGCSFEHDRRPALPDGALIPATVRSACRCGDRHDRELPARGIGRCNTLRSWLSQVTPHDRRCNCAGCGSIDVPVMVVQGTADPVVVPQMAQQMRRGDERPHRTGQGGDALLRGTARAARLHAGHARRLDPAEHR